MTILEPLLPTIVWQGTCHLSVTLPMMSVTRMEIKQFVTRPVRVVVNRASYAVVETMVGMDAMGIEKWETMSHREAADAGFITTLAKLLLRKESAA